MKNYETLLTPVSTSQQVCDFIGLNTSTTPPLLQYLSYPLSI